jgi:hypothetical protein
VVDLREVLVTMTSLLSTACFRRSDAMVIMVAIMSGLVMMATGAGQGVCPR